MEYVAKVLIVDDEPAGRETLEALLLKQKYDLFFASNGFEALRICEEIKPDLVLLDVMMPGLDGYEVCRKIRDKRDLAEIPIIMVTALDDQDSRIRGIEAGADDFISKPFNRIELRARIRTIIRLNRYRGLVIERTRSEEKEKQNSRNLAFLSRTALGFVELAADDDIFTFIGEKLLDLIPHAIIVVNEFNEQTREFTTKALVGVGILLTKITELVDGPVIGMTFPVNEEAYERISHGGLIDGQESLHGIALELIPKPVTNIIDSLQGFEGIKVIGFSRDGHILASALILSRDRRQLSDTALIEAFSNQASIALEHYKSEQDKRTIQAQYFHAQKMEAIGILAGGVAHDFSNLLTIIRGYTELRMLKSDKNDPFYNDLESIRQAAVRANDLTRQLLTFSRKQPLSITILKLNSVIENFLKMMQRIIGEDIEIETRFDDNLGYMKGDKGNIEQILMNLAVNARDAMPEGGKIVIKTEQFLVTEQNQPSINKVQPGRYIRLSVSDTGVGMDQETLDHIFEPFFTTKEEGKGTGLGLSVVYGLVKQHQGWIRVHSEPDQVTRFELFFPTVAEEVDPAQIEETSVEKLRGKGERILLVEDDSFLQTFAAAALREYGYIVFDCGSAEEALKVFAEQEGTFDLLFSDVVLPRESSLEMIDSMLDQVADMKVLTCSGYFGKKPSLEQIKDRGIPFIAKPYALEDLLKKIKNILEK